MANARALVTSARSTSWANRKNCSTCAPNWVRHSLKIWRNNNLWWDELNIYIYIYIYIIVFHCGKVYKRGYCAFWKKIMFYGWRGGLNAQNLLSIERYVNTKFFCSEKVHLNYCWKRKRCRSLSVLWNSLDQSWNSFISFGLMDKSKIWLRRIPATKPPPYPQLVSSFLRYVSFAISTFTTVFNIKGTLKS